MANAASSVASNSGVSVASNSGVVGSLLDNLTDVLATGATVQEPSQISVTKQPQVVDPKALFQKEVTLLQTACSERHANKGAIVRSILIIAALIVAIWAVILLNSILFGLLILFVVSCSLVGIHNALRNHDYKDVKEALNTNGFKQYIQKNAFPLSIESIVSIYKTYKKYVVDQTQDLLKRAHEPIRNVG